MSKRTAQNVAEQLNPLVDDTHIETPGEAVAGAADGAGETQTNPDDVLYNEHAVLDAKLIAARIFAAMELAQLAFTDMEVRLQGTNGRLYRRDRPMPDGVHYEQDESGTEIEVRVNRLEWKAKDVLSSIVNKFERSLDNEETRIADQQKKLAQTIRLEGVGRATQGNVDFETNKLETMIEQSAVTLTAFRAAYQAYADLTGEEYETKAMRQERERLMAAKPTAVSGDARVSNLLNFKPQR